MHIKGTIRELNKEIEQMTAEASDKLRTVMGEMIALIVEVNSDERLVMSQEHLYATEQIAKKLAVMAKMIRQLRGTDPIIQNTRRGIVTGLYDN